MEVNNLYRRKTVHLPGPFKIQYKEENQVRKGGIPEIPTTYSTITISTVCTVHLKSTKGTDEQIRLL